MTKPCHTCAHRRFISINMGGMQVAMWGCLLKRLRFGMDADFKAGTWQGNPHFNATVSPMPDVCEAMA